MGTDLTEESRADFSRYPDVVALYEAMVDAQPDLKEMPAGEVRGLMLHRVHSTTQRLEQEQELMLHRAGSRAGWTSRPMYFIAIAAFWIAVSAVALTFQATLGTDIVTFMVGVAAIQLVQIASEATYRDQDRSAILPLFEKLRESRVRLLKLQDHLLHG